MPKPSQHTLAISALTSRNTSNFNRYYSKEAVSPSSSRPSSPMSISIPKANSQFELAKLALSSKSPKNFNERYGFSKRRRKTRKYRKARRTTRKN